MLTNPSHPIEKGVFELFPMNSKTLKGRNTKRRYRAKPATRIICAASMLMLVCFVGVSMKYIVESDRRRLSGEGKIECNNSLDQIPVLAVIIYAMCLIILFIGLANITDEYFVPALTVTGKRMKLSEDVTGATLMASGSSAPELFTSGVDAFLHGTSIGIGTIVGSAVFNILVIIACSGAFATKSLVIDWKPFTRDCTFYSISIILLVYFLQWDGDEVGRVWWWEGLIMFLSYGVYVTIMAYNGKLMDCLSRCETDMDDESRRSILELKGILAPVKCVLMVFDPNGACTDSAFEYFQSMASDVKGVFNVRHDNSQGMFYVDFTSETDLNQEHKEMFMNLAREAVAKETDVQPEISCKFIKMSVAIQDDIDCKDGSDISSTDIRKCSIVRRILEYLEKAADFITEGWMFLFRHIPDVNTEELEDEYDAKPTCELELQILKKERGYQCTFALSIFWIGFICVFMVECAERIGCLIGIESLFMGLTVLAAGTSIPDALGSIASAKRGMGDMAVANAIGSNVFDILIGLGLPWFLRGVIKGEAYFVSVDDLIIFIGILFSTIFITLAAFLCTRWKLGPTLGKILLAAYFIFLFFAFVYVYVAD